MEYKGFFDLKVEIPDGDNIWQALCDYNIRTIAINQYLDISASEGNKKKKNDKKEDIVPAPANVLIPEEFKGKVAVLKRLTINLSDGSSMFKIAQSPNFKLYDIIAAVPANPESLQICCSSNDIDMICFEPQSKPRWNISRKLYKIVVQKNIFFEIQYSNVIIDSTSRRNTIQVAHSFHSMGKSRNIIISSGANKPELLRSPYDVINFCFLLGFNEINAKRALTLNAKQLLLRAGNRRQIKSVLNVSLMNGNQLSSVQETNQDNMEVEDCVEKCINDL